MTYPSIRYNYDPYIEGYTVVEESMQCRPDLISRAAYGTVAFWDLLFKFNGISNPFSVEKGEILFIPSLDDMNDQLAPNGAESMSAASVRKQYIDISKKAKADPKLAEVEKKRREAQKAQAQDSGGIPSTNNLPPNIAEEGNQEIVIKGGKVYFGPNVSKNIRECECEKPLSKSEFISKLIKSKLK
jgi:hypothetical protein